MARGAGVARIAVVARFSTARRTLDRSAPSGGFSRRLRAQPAARRFGVRLRRHASAGRLWWWLRGGAAPLLQRFVALLGGWAASTRRIHRRCIDARPGLSGSRRVGALTSLRGAGARGARGGLPRGAASLGCGASRRSAGTLFPRCPGGPRLDGVGGGALQRRTECGSEFVDETGLPTSPGLAGLRRRVLVDRASIPADHPDEQHRRGGHQHQRKSFDEWISAVDHDVFEAGKPGAVK